MTDGETQDGSCAEAAPVDWERLARAELHPVRVGIVDLLELDGGRTLSISEMAYELRLPLTNVRYHAKALLNHGTLRLVAQWLASGAIERFYCLQGNSGVDLFPRPPFSTGEFELVDQAVSLYRKNSRLPTN